VRGVTCKRNADSGVQNQHNDAIDEEAVQDAHHQAYERGAGGNLPASSLGSAAALQVCLPKFSSELVTSETLSLSQVFKKFTSGGGGGGSGGGSSQTQLISMAMAEASKLFDQSGGGSGGGKQDAVNGAAMTVMKLLVQSKFSGGMTGGGNSGGLGSLMGLVRVRLSRTINANPTLYGFRQLSSCNRD
jgi:hypothetical protein